MSLTFEVTTSASDGSADLGGTSVPGCRARCGLLTRQIGLVTQRLETPCVLLATDGGLPFKMTPEQALSAKLPPHGYVIDAGQLLYLCTTKKIHSSHSGREDDDRGAVLKEYYAYQRKQQLAKEELKRKRPLSVAKTTDSKVTCPISISTDSVDSVDSSEMKSDTDLDLDSSADSVFRHFSSRLHSFLNLKEYFLLLDYKNPAQSGRLTKCSDKTLTVTTSHGRQKVSMREWMQCVAVANCDLYCTPAEDVRLDAGSKSSTLNRASKQIKRTLKLFSECCALHSDLMSASGSLEETDLDLEDESGDTDASQWLGAGRKLHSQMFATIQGGKHVKTRRICTLEMRKRASAILPKEKTRCPMDDESLVATTIGATEKTMCVDSSECGDSHVFGYMIGGLGLGETTEERQQILDSTVKLLEEKKPRMVRGISSLDDVLRSVWAGVDIIVSGLPTELTQKAMALCTPLSADEYTAEGDLISLRDLQYQTDARPICKNCQCFTCQNHSRAYIRHLFSVHEMNADILLQIHNVHRYLQFVQNIRVAIKNGRFQEFQKWWFELRFCD